MLHNGKWYNRYLEIALGYLPDEIYEKYENKIEFFTTAECDACRIARVLCEEKEIILLSERILPNTIDVEDNNNGRYFIFSVLHEIVHAIKKHRPPKDITPKADKNQEEEADNLAFEWFNKHVESRNNAALKPITQDEINEARERNQKLMHKCIECYKSIE